MKYLSPNKKLTVNLLAGSLLAASAMAAPQAVAGEVAAERIRQLEQSLQAIQVELQRMKSESAQAAQKVKSIEQTATQTEQKINQTEKKINSLEERKDALAEKVDPLTQRIGTDITEKTRMLHFRGGFTHQMNQRNGSSIQSIVAPVGAQDQAGKDGWYVGAGIDWGLTRDMWGFMPRTTVFAELMFEYKQFGNHVQGNALANAPTMLAGGSLNPINVTVSQFTLTASPKIKFFEGSKIRPWIIPAGLAIHVMSPTSEAITYLAPGIQFGAGVDYNIWKDFFIGIDGRYQLVNKTDGVNLSGMTAGGYVGIGF